MTGEMRRARLMLAPMRAHALLAADVWGILGGCPIIWLVVVVHLMQGLLITAMPEMAGCRTDNGLCEHIQFAMIHLPPRMLGLLLVASALLSAGGVVARAHSYRWPVVLLAPSLYLCTTTLLSRLTFIACACTTDGRHLQWPYMLVNALPGIAMSSIFIVQVLRLALGFDYGRR